MNVVESTRFYEAWLADQTDLQRKRLGTKHAQMATGPLPFLRATFYRWIQQWRKECRQLDEREEDVLLAVGDLHLENFGTWRDSRGRVVWGVLDYDEACRMPFTIDLVRLAASLALAMDRTRTDLTLDKMAACLLAGYEDCLLRGGTPVLVAEMAHPEVAALMSAASESSEDFWTRKLRAEENPPIKSKDLPRGLEDILRAGFPRGARPKYFRQRKPEELGSLGRRSYLAVISNSAGHLVAREAKALVPSAIHWLEMHAAAPSMTATLLQRAVRSPDPSLQVHDRWLIRQLAPDAVRLEASMVAKSRAAPTTDLLRAMGSESANIHLGSKSPGELQTALRRLTMEAGADWLEKAAARMARATVEDQLAWEKHWSRSSNHAKREPYATGKAPRRASIADLA